MIFYNDTNRKVNIHPGTIVHGVQCEVGTIEPKQQVKFTVPKGVQPWVKLWDHGESGLTMLVSAAFGKAEEEEEEKND